MKVNLVQIRNEDLLKIIEYGPGSLPHSLVRGSLPPIRVFLSAQRLLARGEDPQWALPYLIISDGVVVGCCGFKGITRASTSEIGYNIAVEYQGRGFASEAVLQLLSIAFQSGAIKSVEAYVDQTNNASIAVLKKTGFQCVGERQLGENEVEQHWRKQSR